MFRVVTWEVFTQTCCVGAAHTRMLPPLLLARSPLYVIIQHECQKCFTFTSAIVNAHYSIVHSQKPPHLNSNTWLPSYSFHLNTSNCYNTNICIHATSLLYTQSQWRNNIAAGDIVLISAHQRRCHVAAATWHLPGKTESKLTHPGRRWPCSCSECTLPGSRDT